MEDVYPIFTIRKGEVTRGVTVSKLTFADGKSVPAIFLGRKGYQSRRQAVTVSLPRRLFADWERNGEVQLMAAALGNTKSGNPKLIHRPDVTNHGLALIVVLDSDALDGDRAEYWECMGCDARGWDQMPTMCPKCGS